MNMPVEQAELADDAKANRLLVKINQQIVAKELINERIRWLQKKLDYRDNKIRKLAKERTETLNFELPLTLTPPHQP